MLLLNFINRKRITYQAQDVDLRNQDFDRL
jgi:hypothetical protein